MVANLRTHAAALRRILGDRIVARSGGYELRVASGEFDVEEFLRLADQGRAALSAGEAAQALPLLTAALRLWRGPAGDGLQRGTALDGQLTRLDEERLRVVEDQVEARLAQAEHTAVLGLLRQHLALYPLRERAWGQLMLALYRSGDAAAALRAYQEARDALDDQLGMEPGPNLDRLHRAVLDRAPELDLPHPHPLFPAITGGDASAGLPRELPPDIAAFVGRTEEVARVVAAVRGATADGSADGSAVVVVSGPGGGGKSAVAIRAAHQLLADFPDGQIFIDLAESRHRRTEVSEVDVVARALRAFGVPAGAVPASPEERVGRYRSLVAARRTLVVVDNVTDAKQVQPLIPAGRASALITIARRRLTTLDGARHVPLGPLSQADAYEVVAALAGTERLAADPAAAAELIGLCDGLPLALRIVGARLAGRPLWPVRTLVEQLRAGGNHLDALVHEGLSIRVRLTEDYELLRADNELSGRAFRFLGGLPPAPVTSQQVAAALAVPAHEAWEALERLVDAHLARPTECGGYRLPPLAHEYAAEAALSPARGA
ncbi:AfsR/SARP family transcriptional regulator [Micromonospora pisi]|nr:AfsR/SARP family transcriptional regulator [Micromonospora pisi]